jgi:hypothetical protein
VRWGQKLDGTQGPRLMAWTTKSPILENHWVPWGCMAHLGSVKPRPVNVSYVNKPWELKQAKQKMMKTIWVISEVILAQVIGMVVTCKLREFFNNYLKACITLLSLWPFGIELCITSRIKYDYKLLLALT